MSTQIAKNNFQKQDTNFQNAVEVEDLTIAYREKPVLWDIDLKVPARFMLARKIAVDFEQSDPTSKLWKTHKKARKEFQQVFTKIQNLDEYESMSTPERSFLFLKNTLAEKMLENCNFCEHSCNVDRKHTTGFCGVGYDSYVSSAFLHTGEEPPLVPSGTIFFSGCNLRCAHCQNYDISCNPKNGTKVTSRQLASIADELASPLFKTLFFIASFVKVKAALAIKPEGRRVMIQPLLPRSQISGWPETRSFYH